MVNRAIRRVLLVSPHFPPTNAADHQRVRMSLPYFDEFGWNATVLAAYPESVEGGTIDPLLEQTIPPGIDVIRVGALPINATRRLGLGSLALRSLPYLWKEGNRLLTGKDRGHLPQLQGEKFDLVYFSTTLFPVMILGSIWRRRFGMPYVTDFQDPWLDDYYERTGTRPPGGRLKHSFSRWLARWLEPKVMRSVSEVISVSPAYVETFLAHYPFLRREQFTVLPFGAPERDFELLPSLRVEQRIFQKGDGKQHWVYVGAAGAIMRSSLRLLFSGLQEGRKREPQRWANVRLHFVGTSYAPTGHAQETVEPIAQECGVADLVEERTGRVTYFEALQLLRDADGLLVIGSDSPSYTPSKIYPAVLAKRPMLAVLHEESPAVEILRRCRAGLVVTFDPNRLREEAPEKMLSAINELLEQSQTASAPNVDWKEFSQYSAREMTRRQCEIFDRAVEQKSEVGGRRSEGGG